ncbi:hypothetical protein C0Q70_13002, partial [Pomacea canaliculata]
MLHKTVDDVNEVDNHDDYDEKEDDNDNWDDDEEEEEKNEKENSNSEDFFSVADLDGDGVLQQDEIQADFNKKDINGDGYISLSELIKSFASSWSLEFKMGAFIYYDKLDGNEDGVIDQSAFLSAMKIMDSNIWNGVAKESKENSNSEDFSVVDLDGDGVLQLDELLADFNKNDINGDGYISLSEFLSSYASSWPLVFNMGSFIYYDKLDGNEDGVIDQSVSLSVIKIMDSDGDGEISREEFERNIQK